MLSMICIAVTSPSPLFSRTFHFPICMMYSAREVAETPPISCNFACPARRMPQQFLVVALPSLHKSHYSRRLYHEAHFGLILLLQFATVRIISYTAYGVYFAISMIRQCLSIITAPPRAHASPRFSFAFTLKQHNTSFPRLL